MGGRLAWLEEVNKLLMHTLIEVAGRLDEVEARLPSPRFTLPSGWVGAKAARDLSGYSLPQIYAWARSGKIVSAKDGGHVRIDPASLPRRAGVKTQSA